MESENPEYISKEAFMKMLWQINEDSVSDWLPLLKKIIYVSNKNKLGNLTSFMALTNAMGCCLQECPNSEFMMDFAKDLALKVSKTESNLDS